MDTAGRTSPRHRSVVFFRQATSHRQSLALLTTMRLPVRFYPLGSHSLSRKVGSVILFSPDSPYNSGSCIDNTKRRHPTHRAAYCGPGSHCQTLHSNQGSNFGQNLPYGVSISKATHTAVYRPDCLHVDCSLDGSGHSCCVLGKPCRLQTDSASSCSISWSIPVPRQSSPAGLLRGHPTGKIHS